MHVHDLVTGLEYLNLAAFVALALLTARLWRRRPGTASFWAMLTFAALALVTVVGRLLPEHPHGFVEGLLQRVDIALLLLFPYYLYRFTTAFDPPSPRVSRILGAMTVAMVVWTFALPDYPARGEGWSPLFAAYVVGFFVHWTVLSTSCSWRLWRAGRGQPTVARTRMRLLAGAATAITVALFLSVVTGSDPASGVRAASQLVAFVSAVAFALGLTPPAFLRAVWRAPETRRLQEAISSLMQFATSPDEIVGRVGGPMTEIVGAQALTIRDGSGGVIGTYQGQEGRLERAEPIEIEVPGVTFEIWTSPYAPFFGEEELNLLRTLASLTALALDRARLFQEERDARLALERNNEVMANFVALAAHELRTPITSIHGFVHTLNHLGDRLSDEQRQEVRETLEQQTQRMAMLVEQLLDLSRLDAEAVEITPERFRVRDRIEELVGTVPGATKSGAVEVEVGADLEAEADPNAFERILTNLITNAFRYGEPPVVVRAERSDHQFRVVVEDSGHGVSPDFVPDLFERFTRSDETRGRVGTGLGLAIARSYARAHGGDLLYEHAEPHGARFALVLPSTT
jgi:signal transduction histidine kinase